MDPHVKECNDQRSRSEVLIQFRRRNREDVPVAGHQDNTDANEGDQDLKGGLHGGSPVSCFDDYSLLLWYPMSTGKLQQDTTGSPQALHPHADPLPAAAQYSDPYDDRLVPSEPFSEPLPPFPWRSTHR